MWADHRNWSTGVTRSSARPASTRTRASRAKVVGLQLTPTTTAAPLSAIWRACSSAPARGGSKTTASQPLSSDADTGFRNRSRTAASIGFRPAELSRDRTVQLSLDARAERPRQLDLALVIDTTGSMGDELRYIQTELGAILEWLRTSLPGVDVRVGLVVYRDVGDEYVVRSAPLTSDIDQLQAALSRETASGGGDYPEAMQEALRRMYDLDWRENAVRVGLLIADAPPHEEDMQDGWGAAVMAREGRIHVTPVAASGVADDAEYLMRAMAALTQSRYLFLTDDSGVGLPHDTPEVKCYQVTRLDSLIRRVIAGYMTGERVEASPQEVIRTVGVYDEGVCRRG